MDADLTGTQGDIPNSSEGGADEMADDVDDTPSNSSSHDRDGEHENDNPNGPDSDNDEDEDSHDGIEPPPEDSPETVDEPPAADESSSPYAEDDNVADTSTNGNVPPFGPSKSGEEKSKSSAGDNSKSSSHQEPAREPFVPIVVETVEESTIATVVTKDASEQDSPTESKSRAEGANEKEEDLEGAPQPERPPGGSSVHGKEIGPLGTGFRPGNGDDASSITTDKVISDLPVQQENTEKVLGVESNHDNSDGDSQDEPDSSPVDDAWADEEESKPSKAPKQRRKKRLLAGRKKKKKKKNNGGSNATNASEEPSTNESLQPSEDVSPNEELNAVPLLPTPEPDDLFQDELEPQREQQKVPAQAGWMFRRRPDDYPPAPPDAAFEGQVPNGYDPEIMEAEGYHDGDQGAHRSVFTEDSKTSRWSTIEATKERKIITCLTLAVCCLCMFFMLGIGIGIGVAIGGGDSEDGEPSTPPPVAPPTPAPTKMPSASPSNAPTRVPTESPSWTPSEAPSSGAPSASPSLEPSSSPTLDPLLEFLIENSFDEGVALNTAGTPQRSAYEWLSGNADLDSYSDERLLQRYALVAFFYSTNGPTGWDEEIRADGWLTDTDECEWGSTIETGQCTDGVYINLSLDFAGVGGTMPLEIGLLTGLTRLSVRGADSSPLSLGGELPISIGSLVRLETLRLSGNRVRGTIPTEIGLMTSLRVVSLSNNSIGGAIPTEIAGIVGTTLSIDNNELGGNLPTELFSLTELTTINLENNFLEGRIPREIGNLGNLNTLNLSINDITGNIPTEIGLLSGIRRKFEFAVPETGLCSDCF